jgi:hypothetical protein
MIKCLLGIFKTLHSRITIRLLFFLINIRGILGSKEERFEGIPNFYTQAEAAKLKVSNLNILIKIALLFN